VYVCVCVCVCARACVRNCACACRAHMCTLMHLTYMCVSTSMRPQRLPRNPLRVQQTAQYLGGVEICQTPSNANRDRASSTIPTQPSLVGEDVHCKRFCQASARAELRNYQHLLSRTVTFTVKHHTHNLENAFAPTDVLCGTTLAWEKIRAAKEGEEEEEEGGRKR
jgi:hypothetical protein